jgi:hypothetical protein
MALTRLKRAVSGQCSVSIVSGEDPSRNTGLATMRSSFSTSGFLARARVRGSPAHYERGGEGARDQAGEIEVDTGSPLPAKELQGESPRFADAFANDAAGENVAGVGADGEPMATDPDRTGESGETGGDEPLLTSIATLDDRGAIYRCAICTPAETAPTRPKS